MISHRLGVTAVMLPELDLPAQLATCARLGVSCYQLRPRIIPDGERGKPPGPWGNHRFDLTPERLAREGREIGARIRAAGLEPWGTLPTACIDDADDALRRHAEGAAVSGAGRVRIGPTPYPAGPFDYPAYLARVQERYAAIIERVTRPAGVRILIETHCGTAATSPGLARNLCAPLPARDLGIILDVANFGREGAVTPHLAVAVLRDRIDCVHVGGTRWVDDGIDGAGCRKVRPVSCPLDESDLPVAPWIAALAAAGVDAPLVVEDFGDYADGPGRLARSVEVLRRIATAPGSGAAAT